MDEHDRPGRQRGAAVELDLVQAAVSAAGTSLATRCRCMTLDVVLPDVLPPASAASLGPSVCGDRDEVLDRHRVEHLAAEPLGDHAGADPLAGGVDRRGGAGRPAADDEDVEGRPRRPAARLALGGARVELGDDLLQRHPALAEQLAVEEHGGHGQDARAPRPRPGTAAPSMAMWVMLGLRTLIEVERLDDVGAVLARQREVGLEVVLARQDRDLLEQLGARRSTGARPPGAARGRAR